MIAGRLIFRGGLSIAVLACSATFAAKIASAQTEYYFNNSSGDSGKWDDTTKNWGTVEGTGTAIDWVDGSEAIFWGTAAGSITLNNTNVNPDVIDVQTTGYTFAPSTAAPSDSINFSGSAPVLELGIASSGTFKTTFNAPVTSTSQLTINNQASNGSGAYKTDTLVFANASDSFTGGLLLTAPNQTAQTNGWVSNLSTTTDTFRLDFNVTGANGTGSTTGPIDVAANGVLITNAGSLPAFTLNVSNNIVLNYGNLTGAALGMDATGTVAGTFQTAIGGTKSNSGNTTIIYSGQITDPFAQGTGAGIGCVVITNSLGPGSGGAGITEFSGVQKTYSGRTIMNGSSTAVFQMGLTNVLPAGTTLIFGNSIPVLGVSNGDYVSGQNAQTNGVGALDLNGYSQTIASLQSALDPTAAINGITNTSSTIATLAITGSTVDYYYGAIGISAGVVATGISNNNEALTRTGTGTTVIGNALNGASSTYVGDTNVGDATHTACTLEAGSYTSFSPNSNYTVDAVLDLGNYNNTINSLVSTTGNATGIVTTCANSITNPNSPSGGATLTIGSNTTANAITAPITIFNGSLQNGSGGPLALVKGGAGTQILAGTNPYTGGTTVNDGELTINGSLTSTANAVTVNGGTLNGSGSIVGAVTINAGAALIGSLSIANTVTINLSATFAPGTSGVAGTLTVGGLTINGGSNFLWKMINASGTAGSGYDTISAAGITIGSSALSTPINVNASILDPNFNSAASGQWTLISSPSTISLPTLPNGVTVSNLFNAFTPSNVFGNFAVTTTGTSNNNLTLNYTPVSLQTLTWQGGPGTWQPAGTSGDTAWNNGVSNGPFSLSSIAEFAAGSGGGTVTLGNNVSAAVIRFDTTGYTVAGGSNNYALSDAPSSGVPSLDVQVTNASDTATISAAVVSPLTKFGAGTLVLSAGGGANGNTLGGTGGNPGTLTVYAGTLRGGSTSLNANISNTGTVAFDQSGISTGSYAGAINGTGSVVVQNTSGVGTPVLTFSGASAYTGGTTINSNVTLAVSSAANLGATANITYPYDTVTAASGALTLNGGTLQSTTGITLSGLLTVTANGGAINDGTGGANNYINGGANLQPGATLTKNGSGTLVIPDVGWTGSGTLVINQGSLLVGDTANFQSNPSTFFGGNSLVLNYGTTLTIAAGTASTASITPPKLTLNGNTTIQLFNTGGVTGAGPLNPNLNSVTTVNPGSSTASSTITFQGASGSGLSGSSTITLGNTTLDSTTGIITIQTVADSGTNGASTGVTFGAVTDNGDTIQFLGQGNATNSAQYVAPGSGIQIAGVPSGTTPTMTGQWIIGDAAGVNAQIVNVAVQKASNENLAMTTGNILVNPGSQLDITALLATTANGDPYGPATVTSGPQPTQTITLNGLGPVNSSLTGTTSALSLDAKAQAEFNSHVNLVLGSSTMINLTAGSSTQATIMTFDGLISGSPGTTLTLHGDNNYSPPVQAQPILTQLIFNGTTSLAGVNTVLEGGQIVVNATASLGSGDLTFSQITTRNTDVQLNNATQSIGNLSSTWDSGGSGATQTLELNAPASSGGTTLTINETGVTDFGNDGIPIGSGDAALITGGSKGNVIFAGTSTAQLTLSGLNTYSGYTEITGGVLSTTTLAMGGSGNPSGIGNSTNAASNLLISGGTLQYSSQVSPGVAATTDRLFTVGLAGATSPMFATLDASGASGDSITWTGNGTGSANAIAFGTTTQPATLTLTGSSTDSNTLAPIIGDSGGSSPGADVTSLVKSGVGTWFLTGANTYSGGTTINGGSLRTSGGGTLGTGPLALSAAAGNSSSVSLANSQSVSSLATTESGAGTATILVAPGATLTTGNFSNIGTLNIGTSGSTTGTVAVTGTPTLSSGSLLVNSGTLEFNGSTAATVESGVTATVASGATLQLAGSAPALSNADGTNAASITNNGSTASGGGLSVTGTNQVVGVVSGTPTMGATTIYAGDTVVGNGTNTASLTVTQILQNSLTINAGSTVTIAPSGTGVSDGDAVAGNASSTASVSSAADAPSGSDIADSNDPLTAIQAAIASGSISSTKGTQLENRIAAIQRLAANDPGLDVSLLEDRVLAAIPSSSLWSADGTAPLGETGAGLLAADGSTFAASSSGLGGAMAAFAPAGGVGGGVAAVPEPSGLLLGGLGAIGLAALFLKRRRMNGRLCES